MKIKKNLFGTVVALEREEKNLLFIYFAIASKKQITTFELVPMSNELEPLVSFANETQKREESVNADIIFSALYWVQ